MMPANGHVIPGTPIAVDVWNTKKNPSARLFFLSHFHADHTNGLSSSWKYPIYCSYITGQLLSKKLNIAENLIKVLEVYEDHEIPLDLGGKETMTVILLDANHCPGSVMFLFTGYFGNVLYTGDFRYKPNMFEIFNLPPIDTLYLDNTYCAPKCNFSSREDCIEHILQQIHNCLIEAKRVFIGFDSLGKEDLLKQIYKERHMKICVTPTRKYILDIIGMSDVVTTDKSESNIFVVPTNMIGQRQITEWNKDMKTHAILPTARFCEFTFQPYSRCPEVHLIPLSNHSSYSELMEFVKLVRPSAIKPIIGKDATGVFGTDISHRADMSVFQHLLRDSVHVNYVIPESVSIAMSIWETNSSYAPNTRKRKVQQPSRRNQKSKRNEKEIEISDSGSDTDALIISDSGSDSDSLIKDCHNLL